MFGKKLTIDQVNYLNIFLMLISAAAAFARPFETFLIVYAFLGPLHYLTEISWLHDRNYFTKNKYDYILLVGAGIIITLDYFHIIQIKDASFSTGLTFFVFGAALLFVLTQKILARLISLAVLFLVVAKLSSATWAAYIFGIFLPTLIHVFIFTGLFILVGTLRARSLSGILSLVVFIVCAGLFFWVNPAHNGYKVSDYTHSAYGFLTPKGFTDGFFSLNYYFMDIFGINHFSPDRAQTQDQFINGVNNFIYHNPAALGVMSFIAFAYMYHYLNWFSKTSIIQWHQIPRSRLAAIIILWLGSIGIYAYDYALGLKWLFFLSFSHVLLEFPLNHLTFINIGKEIGTIVSGKKPVPAKASSGSPQGKSPATAKAKA